MKPTKGRKKFRHPDEISKNIESIQYIDQEKRYNTIHIDEKGNSWMDR